MVPDTGSLFPFSGQTKVPSLPVADPKGCGRKKDVASDGGGCVMNYEIWALSYHQGWVIYGDTLKKSEIISKSDQSASVYFQRPLSNRLLKGNLAKVEER